MGGGQGLAFSCEAEEGGGALTLRVGGFADKAPLLLAEALAALLALPARLRAAGGTPGASRAGAGTETGAGSGTDTGARAGQGAGLGKETALRFAACREQLWRRYANAHLKPSSAATGLRLAALLPGTALPAAKVAPPSSPGRPSPRPR